MCRHTHACVDIHISSPSCSNYALRKTADDNEEEYGIAVASTMRRNFYVDDQCDGVAMGFPLPVLANVFMGHEEQWVENYKYSEVLFYRRYADDTCCLLHKQDHAMKFLG